MNQRHVLFCAVGVIVLSLGALVFRIEQRVEEAKWIGRHVQLTRLTTVIHPHLLRLSEVVRPGINFGPSATRSWRTDTPTSNSRDNADRDPTLWTGRRSNSPLMVAICGGDTAFGNGVDVEDVSPTIPLILLMENSRLCIDWRQPSDLPIEMFVHMRDCSIESVFGPFPAHRCHFLLATGKCVSIDSRAKIHNVLPLLRRSTATNEAWIALSRYVLTDP